MLSMVPLEWGPQLHSQAGSVALTRTGPNAISFRSEVHYAILMLTPQPGRIMALNSDRRNSFNAPAGTLELVPSGAELFAEWRFPKENLLFALPPERLRKLAIAEYDNDRVDLQLPGPAHADREALRIARLLEAEFRRGSKGDINEVYLDSLLTIFSTHLLRQYASSSTNQRSRIPYGISASAMARVVDFIRANLHRKINIAQLAAVANLSPSHFNRVFRETMGQPPYQYITSLRLHLVHELSRAGDLPLNEIAQKAGFGTHSQMTALMRRYWGITPSEIRRDRQS